MILKFNGEYFSSQPTVASPANLPEEPTKEHSIWCRFFRNAILGQKSSRTGKHVNEKWTEEHVSAGYRQS